MTAASSIAASNRGNYDLHLALHSNAAPEGQYGQVRGILVFYYPGSQEGERAATIIANNLKEILSPSRTGPGPAHHHFGRSAPGPAPSAFLELGYHDNPEDAAWIKSSLDAVAKNLVISLTDYFDIPFLLPQPSRSGQVDVDWGVLNIRARPELDAPILSRPLTVRH